MSSVQPLSLQDVRELVIKSSISQIKETPTVHLVQAYNYATGRETKKFSSREHGIEQTLTAIEAWRDQHPDDMKEDPDVEFNELSPSDQLAELGAMAAETSAQDIVETADKIVREFRIKLPYTGKTRAPKKNSKRAKLLERMTDGYGILISELSGEPWNWAHKDAYEGVRHIHVSLGYGLDQYPDGRIYAHTDEPGKHHAHQQGPTPAVTIPETDEGE